MIQSRQDREQAATIAQKFLKGDAEIGLGTVK
jgi:hypothetical protein